MNELLTGLLDHINDIVFVVNSRYEIQYASRKLREITGKEPEKLAGKVCHLAIFNSLEPCKDCQLQAMREKHISKNIEHDTITHRGFRKMYSSTFVDLGNDQYAEVMTDATATKKLIDRLTHHTKELKAANVATGLKKKEIERRHKFMINTVNSLNNGLMVVNPDLSISIKNSMLIEMVGHSLSDKPDLKCYELYGKTAQCKDCPYLDPRTTIASRTVNNKTMTVHMNRFDRYVVESLRDTTKELHLIEEIKSQQAELEEKQRQMSLLNSDLVRMNDRLNVAQQQIDEELRQVGEIQESLLPRTLPAIEGYEFAANYTPAEHAGGDYYDCIQMSNGFWGLGVADVSGHGIPAAVIMAMTRAIMRSYTYDVISSAEALTMVNEILCDNIHTNDFVTMFYLVLNSVTGKCNYASAGHNPLLYFDKNAMMVRKVKARGLFLGAFQNVDFEEGELQVNKGDIVFLYTDGLVEAMNGKREQYGYDRLISRIMMFHEQPAQYLVNQVMSDVRSFCDGHPFEDDITILAFKML